MSDVDRRAKVLSKRLSRRGFIKVAAAVSFLAGCRAAHPQPTLTPTASPTSTPRPTETPYPTDTPTPTVTPSPTPSPMPTAPPSRPDVIQTYPEVASKVVHTHHAGVWSGERLDPNALRQMLDASISSNQTRCPSETLIDGF
jgi:hypothetical protein